MGHVGSNRGALAVCACETAAVVVSRRLGIAYGSGVKLRYRHLVFDLDGTLIDSRRDLAASVNHVLGSLDLPELPLETVCAYVGAGARALVQRSLGEEHRDLLDQALGLFLSYYGEHLLDHTRPYPGIVESLAALADRSAALSVLTNKPEAMSRAILDGLGLLERFAAVLGGDSCPSRKPDPAGIERLLALTEMPPEQALLVGDSLIDLRTAAGAGVDFCGVAWGLAPDEIRARDARMIEDPKELLRIAEQGW